MNGVEAAVDGEHAEFRVRVSMERYFSDERARCYMSCSRGRPVRALARRLRRAFGLPRPFALVSRGHLLPPAEPLALLQPDDPVEVIPTKFPVVEVRATEDQSTPSPEAMPARSPSLAPDELDAPAALDDMKRRALDLLDGYTAAPPPARRRRRVRRRRTPRPAAAPVFVPESPLESPPGSPPAAVVRAGAASPRPARLVRALAAEEPATPRYTESEAPAPLDVRSA